MELKANTGFARLPGIQVEELFTLESIDECKGYPRSERE